MLDWLRRDVATLLRDDVPSEGRLHAAFRATLWGGGLYGCVMGGWGCLDGRAIQILYSGIKVPWLLGISTVLALPSFFVLNTLLGLRADFPKVLRAIAAGQGAMAVLLACLAPYTALWYVTTSRYHEASAFNGVMFAVASFTAQAVLRTRYAPLIAGNARHRIMLWVWLFVYCFVAIQMAWVLRPFIGFPGMRPSFFREEAWGNAYVAVLDTVMKALRK